MVLSGVEERDDLLDMSRLAMVSCGRASERASRNPRQNKVREI